VNWITPGAEREWQRARVMWPFRTRRPIRQSDARATIDDAIRFTAHRWCAFSRSIALPPETNLRDRIGIFARSLDASLHGRFPSLAAAPDQVMLLIIAKGIEQSGLLARAEIERALGIILPP